MPQETLRSLINQHDRLVEALTQTTTLDKVLRHIENLHLEGGETTTSLSVFFGGTVPYDKEVVRLAASVVKDVAREMLPILANAALDKARERYLHSDTMKQNELAGVKRKIVEQLGLLVESPAFLRKIMD